VVLAGVGGLVDPSYPDIKGVDDFTGDTMHTARWNHDVDLTGKQVAVIGTGASAVQVVPSIAPTVAMLSVFQRTPAWVVPKFDHFYPKWLRKLLARFPFFLRASRFVKYWVSELLGPIVFLDSKILSKVGTLLSMWNLRRQVRDPDLREKLTPDFQFGCKRVLVSDDYWATTAATTRSTQASPRNTSFARERCTPRTTTSFERGQSPFVCTATEWVCYAEGGPFIPTPPPPR
jgi:cation diffusion facilitator CzcD-associated flavoprotein CzcO